MTAAHSTLESQLSTAQHELEETRRLLDESEKSRTSAQGDFSVAQDHLRSQQEQLEIARHEAGVTKAQLTDTTLKLEAAEGALKDLRASSHTKLMVAKERLESMSAGYASCFLGVSFPF